MSAREPGIGAAGPATHASTVGALPRLVGAELLKLRTTRASWWLLGATVLVQLGLIALQLGLDSESSLGEADRQRDLVANSGLVPLLLISLGAMNAAGEFRHRTITGSYLVTPGRWPVLTTKVLAHAALAVVFGVALGALTLAGAAAWLDQRDVSWVIGDEIGTMLLGWALASALSVALGVALGALLRNQVAAILTAAAYFLIVESVIGGLAPSVAIWLPGLAFASAGGATTLVDDMHGMLTGALLSLGYVAVILAAAIALEKRRDVS